MTGGLDRTGLGCDLVEVVLGISRIKQLVNQAGLGYVSIRHVGLELGSGWSGVYI